MKKLLLLLLFLLTNTYVFSQLDTVNNGSYAGAGDGEQLYTAFQKVNKTIDTVNKYNTLFQTINNKQDNIILTTTGSSGASTLIDNTLNIPQYSSSSVGGSDGYVQYNNGGIIGGALSLQYNDITNRVGINTGSPSSLLTIAGSSGTIASGLTFNTAGTVGVYKTTTNVLIFHNPTNSISFDVDTFRLEEEILKTKDIVITGSMIFNGITIETPDTNQSANISIYRNTDLTITATQNVWYKITGFTVKKNQSMTVTGDSVQIPIGEYKLELAIASTGTNGEQLEFAAFKNGTMENPSQFIYTLGTYSVSSSIPIFISSDGDDWFAFKIRNITDGDDPIIKRFSAVIISLDY